MIAGEPLVLGLDAGTSGVKAVLVNGLGSLVDQASTELTLEMPRPGWSEQSPEAWWQAIIASVQQLLGRNPGADRFIQGIGVSGQMHGAVLLDRNRSPLRPAILWNDQRSVSQCREITERVGFEALVSRTGNRAYPGFQAPKILWVREFEPDIFVRTKTILLPKDYLNFRFTGNLSTEPSDAAGTLLLDIHSRDWSQPVLNDLDLTRELFPAVAPSSAAVMGDLSAKAASEIGLGAGTPVVAGGADNACAALGSGLTDESTTLLVSLGTSGTLLAASNGPRIDPEARLHVFCHVLDEVWYSMGVILSAGASLSWFRDTFGSRGHDTPYDELIAEAEQVPAGSGGVTFLPYLAGERTPHADPNARGAFSGLSLATNRPHLTRAVLEGIAFALRDSLALMRAIGIEPRIVRATGGGVRSRFWLQMIADVLELPIATVRSEGGPAFGAALLAGAGVGLFDSAAHVSRDRAVVSETMDPRPELASAYEDAYQAFRSLYPALAPVFRDSD
ncbi:MAG TPA: xylulokinase [Chloroflexota bacterium]|nr:xylulokinase [Chloroflexota bacterium]